MRWPFVRRSKVEAALASLVDMRDDYIFACEREPEDTLGEYCRGKRDAYRRAVNCLERVI